MPDWQHGELGPGTWYLADTHTADDMPLHVEGGQFRDELTWPPLVTKLPAALVREYPTIRVMDDLSWPLFSRPRWRLKLPRTLTAWGLVETFDNRPSAHPTAEVQRHALAYSDSTNVIRAFLPQVIRPNRQDDRHWLWLDVEIPDSGTPFVLWTAGVVPDRTDRTG